MQILIDINTETQEIKKLQIDENINPIQAIAILTECNRYLLSKIEFKKNEEKKILTPKKTLVGV